MKASLLFSAAALTLLTLSACESVSADPTYSNKEREDLYKHGSLLSDEGGWSFLGDGAEKKKVESAGIGVNGFLWRASLDTVSVMPIASVDPFGGVILTDWYSAPSAPKERMKVNIIIRDRELTANGVKVSVFRQRKNAKGVWEDSTVSASTASSIENAILTRARQLRLSQKKLK